MNYTTLEQSRKLIELGLDPKTADLWLTEFQQMKIVGWESVPDGEKTVSVSFCKPERLATASYAFTPCWSTDALLAVIPHTGFDGIELTNYSDEKVVWTASFHWKTDSTPIRLGYTPLEAVYETVCWLLENGYINKKD